MDKRQTITYPINDQIRADELRVVAADGQNLGVISKTKAIELAEDQNLDLVLIAPSAVPPVGKIVDYNKFIYEQQKKSAEQRKGKKTELKELQFKPNIDDFDLNVRIKRAIGFLNAGNKVKFTIKFFGRMSAKKNLGYGKMDQIVAGIGEAGEIESGPTIEGNFMITYVKPK